MMEYQMLLTKIMIRGRKRGDRTGVGTKSLFGEQLNFNLQKGFPLITTKKVFFKGVVHELLWMISGKSNIKYLKDNNINIWDAWANKNGDLGPVYGAQWRDYNGQKIDQLSNVIEQIKNNPESRRLIVTAWNPAQEKEMALPPCPCFFQFYVDRDELSMHLYQRSADAFLGVPFDIASYSLLTLMIAQICGLKPGRFIHTFGDIHIYLNHREQVKEQLKRKPFPLPKIVLNKEVKNIDNFEYKDIELINYKSHEGIKAQIAI